MRVFPREDLSGKTFGRLLVIRYAGVAKGYRSLWVCICSCGGIRTIRGESLSSQRTRSCGCLSDEARKRKTTHGKSKSRIYRVWSGLVKRCSSPYSKDWDRYGGRGISVCERWLRFEGFYEDMGDAPEGMTLDRIDNNGNYEKSNCRWSTRQEQAANTRRTKYIEYRGESLILSGWARRLGMSTASFIYRLRNWSIDDVMTRPHRTW